MKIKMSNELFERAKPILDHIQHHGFEAYFVGGSVRDYLMGRDIHDIDITTSATPNEIEDIFEKTIPIGKEHGTINVVYHHENYEVTTFRAEEDYVDHRRPSEVHFVRDLYQDVQRRDFTVNAIAMDSNYKTYDYFEGERDLKERLIRTVGEPRERFEEDALRIIRGLRFQAQLDFKIVDNTFDAMRKQIADIQYLSIERIVVELKKLIKGINVAQSFNQMKEIDAFKHIPFFNSFNMQRVHIDEPLEFEMWIAIMLTQQPITDTLKLLKISNNEKSNIHTLANLIETLPKVQSKQDLIIAIYDNDIKNIKNVLATKETLKKNNLNTPNPLILNERSIEEVCNQLPIHHRKEMAINGGDIIQHLNTKSGPWLKDVLRQIEVAIITQQIKNTKVEILEWVDANVKV